MATLYIVGTPIGNLEDISLRALRILGEVDFILCEDTRVTRKLLAHYKINTPTISYHQHSSENKVEEVINLLSSEKNLALVSDAGTPGISDPGGRLIQRVIEEFGIATNEDAVHPVKSGSAGIPPEAELFNGVKIESVPGPSAVTASLSISGMPTDKFIFMGFPPHKKGRQTFIRRILKSDYPAVVYESKHRIVHFLEELKKAAEENTEMNKKGELENKPINLTSVVVCRELSKMHETVYRGEINRIIEKIKASTNDQKGEFVVIVGK
ncbi:MAG: ribosomal RNA small subunit methyltransferase I [Patescibacteria group bacterium]|jgi:16S rRNA (cytidine1402-2'-O)-methyltransferase